MGGLPKLHEVHASPGSLAPDARAYLEALLRAGPDGAPGLWLRSPSRAGVSPLVRGGLGLLLVLAALALVLPIASRSHDLPFDVLRAVLAGAGVFLLVQALARPRGDRLPGSLRYVDAWYAWNVTPDHVDAVPVLGARDVRVKQAGGRTSVLFEAGRQRHEVSVADADEADRFCAFVEAPPAVGGEGALTPPVVHVRRGRGAGGVAPLAWAAAAGAAIVALLGLGLVADGLQRQRLLTAAREAPLGDTAPVRAYLADFPDGPERDEVEELLAAHQLHLLRQGPEADVAAVDAFLERHPKGASADAARVLREDRLAAKAVGAAPRDVQPAIEYLRDYPEGRHVAEIERVREECVFEEVRRGAAGDTQAVETFLENFPETHLRDAAATLREDRYFNRVQGSSDTDVTWIGIYLDRFPGGRYVEEVRRIWDDREYERAKNTPTDRLEGLDYYLKTFPEGRHVDDARNLRVDRVYYLACVEAKNLTDPAPLRAYLADTTNTRHREEAQARIDELYDEAIRGHRTAAAGRKHDQRLVDALSALLERSKTAPSSRVAVACEPSYDLEPDARLLAEEQKTLKGLAKELEGIDVGGAVPYGDCFSEEYRRRREIDILNQMGLALRRSVDANLLRLERAEGDEVPDLKLLYHVRLTGESKPLVTRGRDLEIKRVELIRLFRVDWDLQARQPSNAYALVCHVETRPNEEFTILTDPDDPDWAVYGALLDTVFTAFAAELIKASGLPAPPVPKGVVVFSN